MTDINDAFPSKYLKAGDLKGQTVPLTIEGHSFETLQGQDTKKLVLYFFAKDGKRMPKGLVLNRTNATKISELTHTSIVEEWTGQRVALYPAITTFQGREQPCIRIQAAKATRTPAPTVVEVADDDIAF